MKNEFRCVNVIQDLCPIFLHIRQGIGTFKLGQRNGSSRTLNTIDIGHTYFIGFSGGVQLIYRLASEIGGKSLQAAHAAWEVLDPSVCGGYAMPAYLVQGAKDMHLPLAGGFNDEGEKTVVGIETKVAI